MPITPVCALPQSCIYACSEGKRPGGGRARDQRAVSYGSRAHPRLGHLDVADFHLRDGGAERDPRGRDRLPEGFRLCLQVGFILVGPDPNELVLRPIDPGRHDRPANLVMDRLGFLFEVLDEVIQLALVDRVNADLCMHLLCLHALHGVYSRGLVSGKKRPTCRLTALDLPPPGTRLLPILARSMTENQGQKKRTKRTPPAPHETTRY